MFPVHEGPRADVRRSGAPKYRSGHISVHVIMALVLGGPECMRVVFEQQQQHRRGKLC